MVALNTPEADIGRQAVEFNLLGTDNKYYGPENTHGKNGLIVAFVCNHCPYVQRIIATFVDYATQLQACGVGVIAINSNNPGTYPEDSYENMQAFAVKHKFNFPYVIDIEQTVAKSYGAVCTPDFFGFDRNLKLQYRGRLNNQGMPIKHELLDAMLEIADKGYCTSEQLPSIGCSIKWRDS